MLSWVASSGEAAKAGTEMLTSRGGVGDHSPPLSLQEMKEEDAALEASGAVKYCTVSGATVVYMPHDKKLPFYMACPEEIPDDRNEGKTRTCQKKMERSSSGRWSCAAGHECQHPKARWMLFFSIADHTGQQYVSAFDETSAKVMGHEASECAELWEQKDTNKEAAKKIERMFWEAQFTRWTLRLKRKREVWNDEEKVKVQCIEAWPLDVAKQARSMMSQLRRVVPDF